MFWPSATTPAATAHQSPLCPPPLEEWPLADLIVKTGGL